MPEESAKDTNHNEHFVQLRRIIRDFGRKFDPAEGYRDEYSNIPDKELVVKLKELHEKREKIDGYLGSPANTAKNEIDLRIEAITDKLKISTVK